MKSHELTLIRTEGLDQKELEFYVYIGTDCYGILELNANNSQKTLVLPPSGKLGLRVCQGKTLVGQTFVDILTLEQNGLQWLPVLPNDSGPIQELPEEVPCPRVLISIYSSKSKNPGRPVEGIKCQWPVMKEQEEMEKLELIGDFEETTQRTQVKKYSETKNSSQNEKSLENPALSTVSSESLTLECKKESPVSQKKFQDLAKTTEMVQKVQKSPNFLTLCKKTPDFLPTDQNINSLEETLESLHFDLHKSQTKNLHKKRTIRELNLKLSVFHEKMKNLEKVDENLHEKIKNLENNEKFLHEKMKNLEKNDDEQVSQFLTEKLIASEERILELQETLENQTSQINELQAVISNQLALLNDKEDVINQQESLLNEQDCIIKELESNQSEFESMIHAKNKESEHNEASLKETIKSLESRLKESVKSLDFLESTFKETTAKTINLEIALYELQKQGKFFTIEKEVKETKETCSNCQKLQVEIKGHLENTKRLYQSIEITTEKLNTSEFHNQELIIINQDLTQDNQLLKQKLAQRTVSEDDSLSNPFTLDMILCNSLPRDEIDDLFQQQFPSSYSHSLKLVPQVYLLSNKKIKIIKQQEKLHFFQDNKEILISEAESSSKHEKNSLSLEDVSNQHEYKTQNLIHSRVTRENKLRVLTKQW